jgi:hypothetical protein
MFFPIRNGTQIIVGEHGERFPCWIPPLPEDKSEIINWGLPKEEQYWKREPIPKWYLERSLEEEYKQAEDMKLVLSGKKKSIFIDTMCERYRRRDYYRRKYGVFVMINGEPVYLTNHHFYYLQWCKFDHKENEGYPYYYEFSRTNFYIRQWSEENPWSMGYMFIGPRATGKSNEELACIANRATMLHNHRAALQSKHFENDAKGVLIQAKMVPLFNALPKFQKPEYAHGTNTQSELVFRRRSITGKQTTGLDFSPDVELTSTIFAAPPGEKALDTETLSDLFEDEIGKCNPREVADIYVRHEVNLKCTFRNNRKIGVLRKTSTVEEMDEGGDECFKLWKDSDPKIIDGNGFTTSKIHRHLISALDTDTSLVDYIDAKGKNYGPPCDKYGRVNKEIANIKIQNDFDAVKHDLKKLSGRMRKSPRNPSEAFIKDQSKSIFNIMLITNRLEHIRNGMARKPYVKGNLYWLKEKYGPVWWERDDHAGRFNFAWFPDEFSAGYEKNQMPGETGRILNNVTKEWGYNMKGEAQELITPGNMKLFRIATDPIKYTKTKDPRASKAAIHAFRMYDHLVDGGKRSRKEWETHNFFVEYCNRPDDPAQYVEDLAMLCIFLGTKVLPERNIPYVNESFEQNGLQRLLFYQSEAVEDIGLTVQTTSEDAGYATTPEVTNYLTTRLIPYINQDIDRCPFDDTIEDWGNFDPLNPTKSHLTFSSGLALVHSEKVIKEDAPIESRINEWFESYDNSGQNGTFAQTITD